MADRPDPGRTARRDATRAQGSEGGTHTPSRLRRVVGIVGAAVVSLVLEPLFWLLYFLWEPTARRGPRRSRKRASDRIVRPFGVDLIAPAEAGEEAPACAWAEIRVGAPTLRDGRRVCIARCTYEIRGVACSQCRAFRIPASWSDETVRSRLARACGLGSDVEIPVTRA